MEKFTRRTFAGALAAAPALCLAGKPTDARIESIDFGYEDYLYRAPLKFGGDIVDKVTLLNVNCTIRTRDGQDGQGLRLHADGQHLVVPVEHYVVRPDTRRDERRWRAASRRSPARTRSPAIPSTSTSRSSPNT